MRFALLMSFWLLGLGGASGLLGVAFAQAAGADPGLVVPLDGVGVLHLNPSSLTFPVAFLVVGWMALRSLPAILASWQPSVKIEHIHVLKGDGGEVLTRRDLEELLAQLQKRSEGG